MTAISHVVAMPVWMAVILYVACSVALAIWVGHLLKRNGAHYPTVERELPVTAGSQPHRPFWE